MSEINTIKINEVEYVRADSVVNQTANKYDGMKYVICRTYSAGVFAGYLEAKRAHDVSVSELVSFQISSPTQKEFKRSENTLRLRNRGFDV